MAEVRRPDSVFEGKEGERDLFLDTVGSSSIAVSNVEVLAPGGAAD